jgi:hypothetical protein
MRKLIGAAAPEKRALTVGRDVDVENTREGASTALHTANVHASFSERVEQIVAKTVLPHAPEQTNVYPPGSDGQGAVGSNAAAVQFQLRAKAFAAGSRPLIHAANHVYIEIAKDEKAWGGVFFAAHGGGILSFLNAGSPQGGLSTVWGCDSGGTGWTNFSPFVKT